MGTEELPWSRMEVGPQSHFGKLVVNFPEGPQLSRHLVRDRSLYYQVAEEMLSVGEERQEEVLLRRGLIFHCLAWTK